MKYNKSFSLFPADSSLTIVRRLSGKKQQQLCQSELTDSGVGNLEQYNLISDNQPNFTSDFCSLLENRLKMQPTSNVDNLENLDLTTENLPAVDTPDACDKAALRYFKNFLILFDFQNCLTDIFLNYFSCVIKCNQKLSN